MSTLGFGDITFHSDLAHGFTIVPVTGIMLLIVLPFAIVRFSYALEQRHRFVRMFD